VSEKSHFVCVCVFLVCVYARAFLRVCALLATMHKHKIKTCRMKTEEKELLVGSGEGLDEN
jgi:hypothetical protein